MNWNFHQYYSNRTDGLIGQLLLSDTEKENLKALRKKIRLRTRDVFEEAKQLVKLTQKEFNLQLLTEQIATSNFKYLSRENQALFSNLIREMNNEQKAAFLALSPRFWTQGSFVYNTLNKPYATPPQEMDIDDGTYLPMVFFDDKPSVGHQFLTLLVDTSLKSLEAENHGWEFEAKPTCGRIKIPHMHTHIDVPMYAIPEDKFKEKETIYKAATAKFEGFDGLNENLRDEKKYKLEADCVNLAIREGNRRWQKSDPKDVQDWFEESCSRIGSHLRKVCRFLKAWRDAQWEEGGGPSSISLMAATVEILDTIAHQHKDFGETMLVIANNLAQTFKNGVISPDENDERPLFPAADEHGEKERKIIEKMEEFKYALNQANNASTKQEAFEILNSMYGDRVSDINLIVTGKASPAFEIDPSPADKPFVISNNMKSG